MVSSKPPTMGVLCLQGSFVEHIASLQCLNATVRQVRLPAHLEGLDGIVLPGGESTAFLKLMDEYLLREPLRDAIAGGLPVLATCAGVIVLATGVCTHRMTTLKVLDVTVARNAFGRQVESFEEDLSIDAIGGRPFRGVFIRAPIIKSCGPAVQVLARLHSGAIVACRQGLILATSFHPEFVPDLRVHQYFLDMVSSIRPGTSARAF